MDYNKLCADTIRILSAEAIQKANSGHPGLPMGAADYAFVLWNKFLKFNSKDPNWINRDRFVLSAGHGSMLLYSLLHLSGYDVSLDDIKNFRQLGSNTPGHPENLETAGVETTTGPLGQGLSNAVGMAIAEKMLQARLNKSETVIDHHIYGIMGDGCVMEGISSEAASLAGHLKLDNIIYFYDDNHITIEGNTSLAFSEDVGKKFEAMGWYVTKIDGHNFEEIEKALNECIEYKGKPKLIIAKTTIGKGSPNKSDTAGVHGSPLGDDEIKLTKEALGYPHQEAFKIDDKVYEVFNKRNQELKSDYDAWQKKFDSVMNNPEIKKYYDNLKSNRVSDDIKPKLFEIFADQDKIATRAASGKILQVLADEVEALIGGSADLAPSTKTLLNNYGSISSSSFEGKNLHFGIREHAMAGICNGIALYGFFIPYSSTFLVFTDYARPSIRLAALMKLQVLYVMTHDSFWVGEDGPTHQPVEHYAALRSIPQLLFFRPADAIETADAYVQALKQKSNPSVISLTRQGLPVIDRKKYSASTVEKGAYIIKKESKDSVDAIVIATGSEVWISLEAAEKLEQEGYSVRVVSMPCMELFELQDSSYKNNLLSGTDKIISVECGVSMGWYKYVGDNGLIISLDRFGASAPGNDLAKKFGFNAESVYNKIKTYLS